MPKKTVVTPERETPAHNLPEQGHTSIAVSSGGAATLHTWRNIRLIIGREYKNRVTQRSFVITSIILLVIVFLAAFVPTIVQLITARTTSQTQIVVVNDAGSIAGLNETTLTAYINSDLNGINTYSNAPYAITYQPAASAGGFSQYLTGVSVPFYLLFLIYILLAFFLYATLYAGLGAMVKRQDEVQNATILPGLLIPTGYLLFFLGVASPNAALTKVLSYVPFFTSELMMARLALGTVAWWEIVVTIALLLVAILACTWFAARLYRYGVLMYGQRPGLGQLVKLVRMK